MSAMNDAPPIPQLTKEPAHQDVFGNSLEVNDTVAFNEPGYTYELKTGIILRSTPQKVVIGWTDGKYNKETYKFPKQVAKKV